MAKYTYITTITNGVDVVSQTEHTSLNKQICAVKSLVRDVFNEKEFPTSYIDEAIRCFSNALRSKRTSKERYTHKLLNGKMKLKLTRLSA